MDAQALHLDTGSAAAMMTDLFGPAIAIAASLPVVSDVFIAAIVVTWLVFNLRYHPKVVELGPTILTTLGIFGTFLGVAIGLSHFDTSNVQSSVPALLAGLKTAFWASVFGVGAAVQLKLREFIAGIRSKDKASQASPLNVLVDIREALAGYGDTSLVQQIRLLRGDINDGLVHEITQLRRASVDKMEALRLGQRDVVTQLEAQELVLNTALKAIAAGASEAIVGGLEKVVLSFNETVAGQFGENYRDLNQAVTQLLAWQNDYRDTIQSMTNQLADNLRLLGYAASDFRAVTQGSKRFVQTAERVAMMLDGIEASQARMDAFARKLGTLTEEASGRIPFIEARLYELTSQMTNAVQANQAALSQALAASAADIQQAIRSAQGDFAGAARVGAEQLAEHQRAIAAALATNAAGMTASLQTMQNELTAAVSTFEAQMGQMIRRAQHRMVKLDEHAMESLVKNIAGLLAKLNAQVEAAGAAAERQTRPRPVLHVVGDAGAGED
jgi:hypothetical protein